MVASYVHHIAAWMDGTEGLGDGEYRVYHVVCELIYLNNGPIVMHESGIAGRCNQHVLAFRRNLAKLVDRQKLMVGADGKLSNRRAETELRSRIKPQSNPPQTPPRPPPDPPPTPAQPPPRDAAKPLISGVAAGNAKPSRESLSSLLSSASVSQGIREERKSQKKRKSTTELFEGQGDVEDDWPEDNVERFWGRYPPFRRTAKKTVASKLAGIRRRGEVTWTKLMEGLERYVATDPGEFAKGPVVWLNGGCWDDEIQQRGQNGRANGRTTKVDAFAAAAARRFGGGGGNGAAPRPTDPVSSTDRMGDQRCGAGRGDNAPIEFDLQLGPDGVFRG